MRTLQEHYRLVEEGKLNRFDFLRRLKKELPHLISPYNGYNDATSILKSKRILFEVKADLKKQDKEVTDLNTKHDYSALNVNFDQMLKGMQIEITKNPDIEEEKARDIAIKNLVKDPFYYLKNQAFGIDGIGYEEDVPGLGSSKSDQMEKVKLKEAIRKVLNESKAVSSRLKEIDEDSQIVALENKIKAIQTEIEERSHKISAVEEMEMKDMINPSKVKELQKEIKILEKEKSKMEKMMEKLSKKRKPKDQVVTSTETDTAEDEDNDMVPDDQDVAIDENFDEDFELEDRKQRYGINPEADEINDEDLNAASDYFDRLR